MNAEKQPAAAAAMEKPSGRYPLQVVCLYSDECRTLMTKGHHEQAAFLAAVQIWNGAPLDGRWGQVRHGWHRTVPDSSGQYSSLMVPATPHAPGAYPTTSVVDDADCDHFA